MAVICLPRSTLKAELLRFSRRWLACSSLYTLFTMAGLLILLLGCSAVGYLPYSDRPGPGWGNVPAHFPRLEEVRFFAGWAAVFFLPLCVLWGSMFFFLVEWSGWFGAPRWVIRISGVVLCGVLTLLATDGAGWIIAIAAFPVYGTAFAGALFGGLVLPRFLSPRGSTIPTWQRTAVVCFGHLVVSALITFPFWRQHL
ncbi:MAG TPA: hypothetical protein VI488_09240 [Candidatus Angelobacter sp.]